MKIKLKPNTNSDPKRIPYIAEITTIEATVDFETTFNVPVYVHKVDGKTIYDVELCGFEVETDKLDYVVEMVENLLTGLINMARLPSYVFIARRSQGMYPVYTVGNEVFVTTPGGPVFKHIELAKVREYLTNYLNEAGVLGSPGKSEKLHVRGVNAHSLALMRPIFYLKKRVPGQNDFWAPVFASRDGKQIYTYAASARREVAVNGGTEVLALQKMVSEALMADNRLSHANDLRADRLMPNYWNHLLTKLEVETPELVVGNKVLPIYRYKDSVIALEARPIENRPSIFVGKNRDDISQRIRQDFIRRGKLN